MASKKKAPTEASENIRVIIRCRPLSEKEKNNGYKSAVELDLSENTVSVKTLAGNPESWTFDMVIDNTWTQKDVFLQVAQPMIDAVFDGFNSTIFAYGQSGSGKTFTMCGELGDDQKEGITPRSFHYVFSQIKKFNEAGKQYRVHCSFLELYNGKARDLLARKQVNLEIKETKDKTFFVKDLNWEEIKFEEDLMRYMNEGTDRRQVASTELNADSSRSHSVFCIMLEMTEQKDEGDVKVVTSKLNFVDLAGSERQSKTQATGDVLKQGANINLSLSALGTVIDTIVKGKGHVPFRSSPLTMLLKDSLGGGAKTAMFANINPSEHNVSETISTLRFADRAKQIQNKPKIQMDPKDAKIMELTERVMQLEEKLRKLGGGESLKDEGEGGDSMEKQLEEMEAKLGEAAAENQRIELETKQKLGEQETRIKALLETAEENEASTLQVKEEKMILEQKIADVDLLYKELVGVACDFIRDVMHIDEDESSGTWANHEIEEKFREIKRSGVGAGNADQVQLAIMEAIGAERMKFEESQEALMKDHKGEIAKLVALNEQAQDSLQQAFQRLEKMKAKSEKEVEEKKRAQSESEKAMEELKGRHESEINSLKQMVHELERKLADQNNEDGNRSMRFSRQQSITALRQSFKLPDSPNSGRRAAEVDGPLIDNEVCLRVPEGSRGGDIGDAQAVKMSVRIKESDAPARGMVNVGEPEGERPSEALTRANAAADKALALANIVPKGFEEAQKVIESLKAEVMEMRNGISKMQSESNTAEEDSVNELRLLSGDIERLQREQEMNIQEKDSAVKQVQALEDRFARDRKKWQDELEEKEVELASVKKELSEEIQKMFNMHQDQVKLCQELEDLRRSLQSLNQEHEALKKANEDAERVRRDNDRLREGNKRLEQKMQDKQAVIQNSRQMLQTQQEFVESLKQRLTQSDQRIKDQVKQMQEKEAVLLAEIEKVKEKMTIQNNRKIEDLLKRHETDLHKEGQEKRHLEKKIKKLNNSVNKLKERYDIKVMEYEDVVNRLEEIKLEMMKMQRNQGLSQSVVAMEEQQEHLSNVLQEARATALRRYALIDEQHSDLQKKEYEQWERFEKTSVAAESAKLKKNDDIQRKLAQMTQKYEDSRVAVPNQNKRLEELSARNREYLDANGPSTRDTSRITSGGRRDQQFIVPPPPTEQKPPGVAPRLRPVSPGGTKIGEHWFDRVDGNYR